MYTTYDILLQDGYPIYKVAFSALFTNLFIIAINVQCQAIHRLCLISTCDL